MPKVFLPTPLRPFAQGAVAVDAPGATVAEVLVALVSRHTGLRAHLFDGTGQLRAFVNVYKNDEDIRHLDRERTGLAEGDTLSIVPSIVGGSPPTPTSAGLDPATLSREELQRYAPSPDPARGRPRGAGEAQGGPRAARRRGRARLARARSTSRPPASARSASSTSTSSTRRTSIARCSSARPTWAGRSSKPRWSGSADVNPNVRLVPFEERLTSENALEHPRATTTSSPTARTTSRRAISSTTPACFSASPTSTASIFRFEGQASRLRGAGRALLPLPLSRSRRRRASCPPAPRAECSACCPGCWASSRRPRR